MTMMNTPDFLSLPSESLVMNQRTQPWAATLVVISSPTLVHYPASGNLYRPHPHHHDRRADCRAGGISHPGDRLIYDCLCGGWYFGLKGSIVALREWVIDIDLLMVLVAAGAALVGQPFEGAMLLFLFSLLNTLQEFALDRTRNAIRALMDLRPDTALVKQGDNWVDMPVEQVLPGAIISLRPGDRIPLDGEVSSGEGDVDQASLTGESMPVWKRPGDGVLAGTINQTGSLTVRVTKRPQESTLARMIQLVEHNFFTARKPRHNGFWTKRKRFMRSGSSFSPLLSRPHPSFSSTNRSLPPFTGP